MSTNPQKTKDLVIFTTVNALHFCTALNMQKYGFSLTCARPYKDRIYDSVFIPENTGQ